MVKPLLNRLHPSNIMTASMSTVRAVTSSQNTLDSVPKSGSSDLRRNRSAINDIILTSTNGACSTPCLFTSSIASVRDRSSMEGVSVPGLISRSSVVAAEMLGGVRVVTAAMGRRHGLLAIFLATACSIPFPQSRGPVEDVERLPAGRKSALEGRVVYRGSEIPKPTRIRNTTDPEHCGPSHTLEDVLISAGDGSIQNVVVSLAEVPMVKESRPAPSRLMLDNTGCRFEPHVAVLTTGSILEATNSDRFFHSIHVYGLFNINVGLGPGQSKVIRTLSRPGRLVVRCDVHGWMRSYLWVDDHPYHAVSAEDGSFRIENVPAGSYTLTAWHEVLGKQELTLAFRAGEVSRLNLVYDQVSHSTGR